MVPTEPGFLSSLRRAGLYFHSHFSLSDERREWILKSSSQGHNKAHLCINNGSEQAKYKSKYKIEKIINRIWVRFNTCVFVTGISMLSDESASYLPLWRSQSPCPSYLLKSEIILSHVAVSHHPHQLTSLWLLVWRHKWCPRIQVNVTM